MYKNADEVALLKATATKGSQSPSELADQVGSDRTYVLMSHALSEAAARKFKNNGSAAAVADYVAQLSQRFPDAQILKPTVAEAVIRAALGEHERLEGIDPNDAGSLLFFLTHVMLTDEDLDPAQVNVFVDKVLEATKA